MVGVGRIIDELPILGYFFVETPKKIVHKTQLIFNEIIKDLGLFKKSCESFVSFYKASYLSNGKTLGPSKLLEGFTKVSSLVDALEIFPCISYFQDGECKKNLEETRFFNVGAMASFSLLSVQSVLDLLDDFKITNFAAASAKMGVSSFLSGIVKGAVFTGFGFLFLDAVQEFQKNQAKHGFFSASLNILYPGLEFSLNLIPYAVALSPVTLLVLNGVIKGIGIVNTLAERGIFS